MPKILITGANGCTGRGVLLYLVAKGYSDIFGMVRRLPEDKIPKVTYVIGELTDKGSLIKILSNNRIDSIWHLAAAVHRNVKKKDFSKVNFEGTKNIIQAAVDHGVKSIIFSSTTAVYGKIVESPATENHQIKPKGLYAKSKLNAEVLIKLMCEENGIKGSILRIPIILGKHDRHFYPVLKKLVKTNIMPILGNSTHEVSIVHPYDIGQAFEILNQNGKDEIECFNIISCNRSFKDLILVMEKHLVGKKRFKYYLPYPIFYVAVWMFERIHWFFSPRKQPLINREYARMVGKEWIFDIDKLEQLGYTPMMELDEIVKDTVSDELYPVL